MTFRPTRLILLALLWTAAAFSQGAYVIRMTVEPSSIPPDGNGKAIVEVSLSEGYHVTAPGDGLFSVVPDSVPGVVFSAPKYPEGVPDKFGKVYKGIVRVEIPLKVLPDASPGERIISAMVTIQQCGETNGVCYPPEDIRTEATLTISGPGEIAAAGQNSEKKDIAARVADALEKGSWTALLLVFLGGLLTSFTPCVYPMIPITMAVIGAQAAGGRRWSGFILSLFYVFGISLTFASLGMIAAKTGSLFGSFMNHPVVTIFIAALFLAMGLSMLGAFTIQMPPSVASKLRGKKKRGFLGAFLTGIVSGLIVSPCISPLLVVILAWVAKKGSLLMGFGLLFSFAWGLGVLFILIGTFSGALKALPKSGLWMELIERGFGILLVTLAVFFVKPVLSPFVYACLWAVYLVVLGTFLGAFTPTEKSDPPRNKILKAAAVLLVLTGAIVLYSAMTGRAGRTVAVSDSGRTTALSRGPEWLDSEDAAFAVSAAMSMPILVDFAADWCAACHELDEKTWPDATVLAALKSYVPLRLDMTRNTEAVKALQKKYRIVGMPTVIALSADGKELGRFTGFKPPAETVKFLEAHVR
ncbi:MAG: protein-disulfide reductase DsbD [bacterium]|nr:protein-disulfide reductase DsbD [bacterium]